MNFKLKSNRGTVRKSILNMGFVLIMCLFTTSLFSQTPPPFPDSTLQGGPIAVPFDDYLHLIILGVGLIVAFVVLKKYNRKHSH